MKAETTHSREGKRGESLNGGHNLSGRNKPRATRACDICRVKKNRCDGKRPSCSNCEFSNLRCTYTPGQKKRGLPTGYISDLEKKVIAYQALLAQLAAPASLGGCGLEASIIELLDNSDNLVPGMESRQRDWEQSQAFDAFSRFIVSNEDAVLRIKNNVNLSLESARSAVAAMPQEAVEAARAFEPPALDSKSLQKEPSSSLLDDTDLFSSPKFGSADFAMVDINDGLLQKDEFQFVEDFEDDVRFPVALHYHGLTQHILGFSNAAINKQGKNPFRVSSIFNLSSAAMKASASSEHRKVPLDIFRFPKNLRKLIDNYFQKYHPWLPMLDRILLIRHVARLQQLPNTIPDVQLCNVLALIWAVLALETIESDPVFAYTYACNAVLALESAPASTIETIQAMILLGLYFYKAGMWDKSWVLVLSASRMTIDVRLMRPAKEVLKDTDKVRSDFSTLDNISRERTWATVYVVNTLLAARMGRSPLVRAMDWPTPTISDDGWEEWESWKSHYKPDTVNIDSGRCLLIFNELVKVVSYLNTALTCTIESDETGTSNEPKYSIAYFQSELAAWKARLPEHCSLATNHAPMVAYLHLCESMVWCIVSARLLFLKPGVNPARDSIVDARDRQYTSACVSIREIFDVESSEVMAHYPFIDHFLLMALNFPSMLTMDSISSAEHASGLVQLLEQAATTSIPCRVTLELYQLQKQDDPGPQTFMPQASPMSFVPESMAPLIQQARPVVPADSGQKRDDMSLLLFFSNSTLPALPRFNQSSRLPYANSAPKEELDLFMLDTDFAKNDTRLDKFMRNLGYVSNKLSPGRLAVQTPNLLAQSPEFDGGALADYLQKIKDEQG